MKLFDFIQSLRRKNHVMTMEEVFNLTQMRSLEDCKRYMRVMLDFYFKVIHPTFLSVSLETHLNQSFVQTG